MMCCQKENELFKVDEELIEFEQINTHQSHLRADDIPMILDFIKKETNNTKQVLIDKTSIKKAKQDYRNARMESGFGYIDTSNALVVESENVISYTFKVVTKDLTNFINYIVVEDKATSEMYSYFIKYTPTTEWIENRLPLSSFSGTIDYFDQEETLQTTLTLKDGYVNDFGDTEIDCPEIVFNPIETSDDESSDSSSNNGTGGGTGGAINNDEGTSFNYNPWESWWTGWIATGGGGGGGDEASTEQEISSDGTCGPDCDAAPGVACTSPDHPYNNRLGQINLKSEPTVDNPCVHTGVIAFLISQLEFTPEQVDWLTHVEQADTYESMISYLNTNNYSQETVEFATEAIEASMNGGDVDFDDLLILDPSFKNNEKANCVYNKMKNLNSSVFSNLLASFDNSRSAKLTFRVENIPQTSTNYLYKAKTLPRFGGNLRTFDIILDTQFVQNASLIEIALSLVHEMIHAEIMERCIQIGIIDALNYNNDWEVSLNFNDGSTVSTDFPSQVFALLVANYSNYMGPTPSSSSNWQHDLFNVLNYRARITENLEQIHPWLDNVTSPFEDNLNTGSIIDLTMNEYFELLAWLGLEGTEAYSNLSPIEITKKEIAFNQTEIYYNENCN